MFHRHYLVHSLGRAARHRPSVRGALSLQLQGQWSPAMVTDSKVLRFSKVLCAIVVVCLQESEMWLCCARQSRAVCNDAVLLPRSF